MKLSRVIVPHAKDCRSKGGKWEWSGLTDGHFWGNFAANQDPAVSHNHLWHRVICNDPHCPAIKAVHSSVLINA